jgi:hypothetical protein
MKTAFRYSISFLLALLLIAQSPFALAGNLVAGVGAVSTVGSWSNYSVINIIAGSTLLPSTSKTTVLYIAFTGGTTADIGNMVIYTTAAHSSTIASVIPVKLGGVSNPTVDLTNKKICKTQPVSTTAPCVVRLDPITLTLTSSDDYYFVMYFANNGNNGPLGGASPAFPTTSLTGFYAGGDDTQLKVGNAVPSGGATSPYFLVAVQTS